MKLHTTEVQVINEENSNCHHNLLGSSKSSERHSCKAGMLGKIYSAYLDAHQTHLLFCSENHSVPFVLLRLLCESLSQCEWWKRYLHRMHSVVSGYISCSFSVVLFVFRKSSKSEFSLSYYLQNTITRKSNQEPNALIISPWPYQIPGINEIQRAIFFFFESLSPWMLVHSS